MIFHLILSNKIIDYLDIYYYKNLIRIYNDSYSNIFKYDKYVIFKPDYFIFLQYYFIYTFLYYISNNKCIQYSVSLHLIHICGIIFDNQLIKYDYQPINNSSFLKDTSYLLFLYLFFFKITLLKIDLYKKILMISSYSIFYSLYNLNYIYKERLKYIELNKDFIHPLKLLIVSPNKNFIKNIIQKTKYFTYENFIIFINFTLLILLY